MAEQRPIRLDDLAEDALGACFGADRPAFEGENPAISPSEPELELGPADLDAEEEKVGHRRQPARAAAGMNFANRRFRSSMIQWKATRWSDSTMPMSSMPA